LRDRKILRLIEVLRGKRSLLIQTHNNPDPDSIGSAAALRHLVQRLLGIEPVITFGGIVGRAANRAMLRILQIQMIHKSRCDYSRFDALATVDAQPQNDYTGLPEGVRPTIVIDHHPVKGDLGHVPYLDIGGDYGATSTILAELYTKNGVPIPRPIATALAYGIKSDTQDLGRETSQADIDAYTALYPHIDKRALSRIESERLPEEYFRAFRRAIRNARVVEKVIFSDMGPVQVPDMVAEMADFLLRLEGMRWSVVLGDYDETLYLSIRCSPPDDPGAGEVVRKALRGMGSAGGHGAMAGAQVPIRGFTPRRRTRRAARSSRACWIP
jgi:nanoRNase/pAp phosphatase (c-di-AMP/oligoRNAs hydrolase)